MSATIQKVIRVDPIPEADNIEVASVLGWKVVVRKGEFRENDLCVFIDIDSLIPRKEWSEFLFKDDKQEYKLRTVKLRKQISQGLILPITVYQNYITTEPFIPKEGTIVSDLLGIKHYEKPISDNSKSGIRTKRSFPPFLKKTDEERIQNVPWLIDRLKRKPYYITQKLDGTSATYYKNKEFGVCSRNLELKNPYTPEGFWNFLRHRWNMLIGKSNKKAITANVYWRMAKKYDIESWLPDGYAIQGEICGPGIQKNPLGLKEPELFIFNVWKIKESNYIYPFATNSGDSTICVPVIENGISFNHTIDSLLALAEKQIYPNGEIAEGIVVRSMDQTISFKVINNSYLLKHGE